MFILTWRLDPNEYGYLPKSTKFSKSIHKLGTHFSLLCDDNPVDIPCSLSLVFIPKPGKAPGKTGEDEIFEFQMAGVIQSRKFKGRNHPVGDCIGNRLGLSNAAMNRRGCRDTDCWRSGYSITTGM